MQRRVFLKSGALALVTMGLSPTFLRRMVYAQATAAGRRRGRCSSACSSAAPRTRSTSSCRTATRATTRCARTSRFARPGAAVTGRSISTDSSDCIRRWRRSSRCGIAGCSHRCTRWGVRAARARTSMRRTTWRRGTPDVKGTPDGWLNRYLAAKDTCAECRAAERRRSARWRSRSRRRASWKAPRRRSR